MRLFMFPIDIRTTYLSIVLINIINLILMILTYFQIKKRFPGTMLILASFFMSAVGNILVIFRNVIADWLSIPMGNFLIVASCVVLLIGFEKFADKRSNQIHNYVLLAAFLAIHSYFTFGKPDLYFRLVNLAGMYVLLSSQIAYLMLKRVGDETKKITQKIGIVFVIILVIQMYRLLYLVANPHANEDFFSGDATEALFLLSWQIIVVFLAYSISLMYNKRLITELNTQEEKFSKAFHTTPFITILSKLSNGKVFEVNKSIEAIAGYKPKELIGRKANDLKLWKEEGDRQQFIAALVKNKFVKDHEYVFKKANGDFFFGLITAQIITINNEQCMIASVNDISSRKEAEEKLIESQNTLRELNATKDKFFSIIAHDLRSPFNGIIGFTELLKSEVQENNYDGILQYAEIINSSSHHAMDLLSNLMEWTRSQTGRIAFKPKVVDINETIQNTMVLFQTLIEQKNITISLNLEANASQYADQAMIEAILRNLISNAIKFTPNNGKLNIQSTENDQQFQIAITDSGIGIPKNDLHKLFKIDSSYSTLGTNNEGGTGLGLILCKDFIDYHKGHIWAESSIGEGSSFFFAIPKNRVG